jgi:AICAR transformylase/IMP cyclohydrolase PurH
MDHQMETNIFFIELLPGIWVSNVKTHSEKLLKEKKISDMIDCTKELTFFDSAENYILSIKHQIKKEQHAKLQDYLFKVTELIHHTIHNSLSLLIYDPTATRKAPVLIIAYLLRYGEMNPHQTIQSYMSKSKLQHKIDEDYQLALKNFYTVVKEES